MLTNYLKIAARTWTFLVAGLMALGVAFMTVSVQATRAALTNPVESLRHE